MWGSAEGLQIAPARPMQPSTGDGASKPFIATHSLDPDDASAIAPMRAAVRAAKGARLETVDARAQFDALMERVPPPGGVTFEAASVGDIPGFWIHPAASRSGAARST